MVTGGGVPISGAGWAGAAPEGGSPELPDGGICNIGLATSGSAAGFCWAGNTDGPASGGGPGALS